MAPRQKKQKTQKTSPQPAGAQPHVAVSERAAALLQSAIENHERPVAGIQIGRAHV